MAPLAVPQCSAIFTRYSSSAPNEFTLFNNRLYFGASNASGNQWWKTDGTTAGTVQVTNVYPSHGYDVYVPVVFDNQLFFQGYDSITGWQLFSMNTSDSITLLAPAISPNLNPLDLCISMAQDNNSLVYCASYNSIGNELWFYTPAPTAIGHVAALNGINVYPNPFTGNITLTGLHASVEYQLTLTDIQGRELEQYQLTGTGAANTLQLPATLASGVYMLQLSNGDATETVKLVKE